MVEIRIGTNEQGQRLDRFLRKYLPGAPLSMIYRIIRKDVKVDQKRRDNEYMLQEGDVITLYLDQDEVERLHGRDRSSDQSLYGNGDFDRNTFRKTFRVVYEDEEILIVDKPAGLLTHGDRTEKSRHLTNQVQSYLMEKGEYEPGKEKTFAPSPVNRIDRNTSGLVIFAKTYDALKQFNEYIREREKIGKFYRTIVKGELKSAFTLSGMISKDEERNISGMQDDANGAAAGDESGASTGNANGAAAGDGLKARTAVTHVKPVKCGTIKGIDGVFTLAEVEIETGRTHQIRVQLADAGYPLIGDPKYGDPKVNRRFRERFDLTHQLLTAYRLEFGDMDDKYPDLSGKKFEAKLPRVFEKIQKELQQGK